MFFASSSLNRHQ